jgi:hypothetical protein
MRACACVVSATRIRKGNHMKALALALLLSLLTTASVTAEQGGHTPFTVCHKTGNGYNLLDTADVAAYDAHIAHGDIDPINGVCPTVTEEPTSVPTIAPTESPTSQPTLEPTLSPTEAVPTTAPPVDGGGSVPPSSGEPQDVAPGSTGRVQPAATEDGVGVASQDAVRVATLPDTGSGPSDSTRNAALVTGTVAALLFGTAGMVRRKG